MFGSIIGGLLGIAQSRSSAKAAQRQTDQQIELANTAVQRRAKDLEAAGFNRILAAKGEGAATPVGVKADPLENLSSNVSNALSARAIDQRTKTEKEVTKIKKWEGLMAQHKYNLAKKAEKDIKSLSGKISSIMGSSAKSKAQEYKEYKAWEEKQDKRWDAKSKHEGVKERFEQRKRRMKLFKGVQ